MCVCATTRDIIFAALSPLHATLIKATFGGDVCLDPDDRLYACFTGLLIKFKCAKDIAMIRYGDGGHLLPRYLFY